MKPRFRVGQKVSVRDYHANGAPIVGEVKAISQSKMTLGYHYVVAIENGPIVQHISRGQRYLVGVAS